MSTKAVAVVGAGVVGLSIARAAARQGLQVIVLEKNGAVGMETSSRNSEVIHAGIYYKKDSWKAKLCVRGRSMLYEFCKQYHVPFRQCGKLIVAQDPQLPALQAIGKRGGENGVTDLRMLTSEQTKLVEPEVECRQALYSPSTGIIDSHALMLALQGDAEDHGAVIAKHTFVDGGDYNSRHKQFTLSVVQNGQPLQMECEYLVNASGMFAPQLWSRITIDGNNNWEKSETLPSLPNKYAKGTYFKLRQHVKPFTHLVYPIPEVGGLGVHSTIDLEGNVRFGPDVEWVETMDFTPHPSKAVEFAERIEPYWPAVHSNELIPDYCGIRPKIQIGSSIYDDFYIADESLHQIPGCVHLCGIESPGLTSCLAIAELVVNKLLRKS